MRIKILLFLLSTTSISVYSQEFDNPVSYMQVVTEDFETIQKETWDYTKAVARGKSARKIEKRRIDLIEETKKARYKVSKLPGYNGDIEYKTAVTKYLTVNNIMLKEDYGKIVNLEAVAEESFDAMEAYINAKELASEKHDSIFQDYQTAQREFATKNNITLVDSDNKRSEKLKIASQVFSYYNDVYLIFFKSYKQEIYLMDAVASGDLSAIEQNRKTLIKFSKEGIANLENLGVFNNDKSVIQACADMLNFYIGESEKYIPDLANFYSIKSKFERETEIMEKKKSSKLTKNEVDNYNSLINQYNEAVGSYNKVNDYLNNERTKRLENFNEKSDDFLNSQVPR